ncbi:unnamed protein product [Dicrocoelium dendriticum]|nr:unnamed protein product [Dicrocoelium dendriticum]
MKYSTMISQNDNPQWNQFFRFNGYDEQDIAQADLEVTLWTCEPDSSEQTFIGEVIIDLSVADLTGLLYRYPLQLEPSSEFSSEAATPVLDVAAASDPRIALSHSRSPRRTQQSVTGRMAPTHESPHLVPAKVGEDLTHQATAYDETDESTHDTGVLSSHMSNRVDARQMRRHFPLGSPRVGKSYRGQEPQLHSDVSEYSDISDVSRISIRTARSDRSRNRQSDNLAHFTTPYHQASAMGSNNELLPESYSPVRREYDLPEKSSNEPRVFHHGPTFPADDERRQQKESSSSECGSILMESSDGRDVGYREKPKEFHPIPPEQHNRVKNGSGWKTRPSISHKFSTVLGRSGKSSSTSNLDKKRGTRFQRSEEVLPFLQEDRLTDSVSETAGSSGSLLPVKPGSRVANEALHRQGERDDRNSSRNSPTLSRNESHVGEFVEGLGPGQLVGRQVLGMPCLGEIQLSFFDRKGRLEIEVIRARGLQHKNANKPIPAPYVKLHLLEGKISVEKLRTTTAPRRTLDPLYQQQLAFSTPYHGKVIQVSVWGEYGRMDKKVFLGMCEVVLDDLDLKSVVFGWYKLFGIIASNAHHRHQSRNLHQSHSGLSVPDAEFNSDIAKKESRSTLSKGKASSFIDRRRKRTTVEK